LIIECRPAAAAACTAELEELTTLDICDL